MQTLNDLEAAPLPIAEEERNHTRRLLAGLICALLLTGLLLGGYLYLQKRHQREMAPLETTAGKAAPRIEVFVDEATLDGKQTVLGGTIHNISNQPVERVAVELELRKRAGGGLETMVVAPEQALLGPDASVRYSVTLPVSDYSSARLFRVMAGEGRQDVPFKALPGAARPPMPVIVSKTIIVRRPAPKGEEFINTPDNPARVP
ncbi:MAG: hypothetical protein DMF71_18450 [Acidobacteria bacterium]|nr:MAG: hypothetical protein DMF71_18450 [Acidobacteriota bacterium]